MGYHSNECKLSVYDWIWDVELEDIALENKDSAKQDKRINRIAINIKVAANKFFRFKSELRIYKMIWLIYILSIVFILFNDLTSLSYNC